MHLAVPAYFGPWEQTHWAELLACRPELVVINPDTGPGATVHSGYQSLVRQMRRSGTIVLGYVPTWWGQRPIASCRRDGDRYVSMYGTSGVFFDEVTVELAALSNLRTLGTGYGHVGFNPGRVIPQEFRWALPAAVWVTFEGTARRYLERSTERDGISHPTDCHLVHSVPRSLRLRVERALQRFQPGFSYVTADRMPNPWDVFDPGNRAPP